VPEFDRITFDPNVMGGRACIRGMRITVSLIVNLVANGMNELDIIDAYPYLEPADIHQALKYAAWLTIVPRWGDFWCGYAVAHRALPHAITFCPFGALAVAQKQLILNVQ
jgi:uncharacterized protein (DUF433 family)